MKLATGRHPPRVMLQGRPGFMVMFSPWFLLKKHRLACMPFGNSKGETGGYCGTIGPFYIEKRPPWEKQQ